MQFFLLNQQEMFLYKDVECISKIWCFVPLKLLDISAKKIFMLRRRAEREIDLSKLERKTRLDPG